MRRARKSIAQFKIREGMPVGARVTLRGARMYEFLDRLSRSRCRASATSAASTRARSTAAATTRSGIREQIIFPEINYDDIQQVRGLDVAITTTAKTDEQALALLRGLGLPFAADGREQ